MPDHNPNASDQRYLLCRARSAHSGFLHLQDFLQVPLQGTHQVLVRRGTEGYSLPFLHEKRDHIISPRSFVAIKLHTEIETVDLFFLHLEYRLRAAAFKETK